MFKIKSTSELLSERGLDKGGRVQKYIDSEVCRCMDSYTPMLTGMLKNTIRGKGSGLLEYVMPYARNNYYSNSGNGKEGLKRGGNRGRLWFERMKPVYLRQILEGAAKISGGRRK